MPTNEKISKYINSICENIKYKPIHQNISNEVENHISESIDVFIENGVNKEQAIDKAIEQMGNPKIIGKGLNKIHRPKIEWKIIVIVLCLLGFGLFVLSTLKDSSNIKTETLLLKQTSSIFLGIILSVFIFFFDYRKLEKYCLYTFLAGGIMFIIARFIGIQAYGVYYIVFGDASISPVYIALLLYSISFVGLLNKYNIESLKNVFILIGLSIISIVSMLIYPSFATATILVITYLVLVITKICSAEFKGNKKKYMTILTSTCIGIVLLFSIFTLVNNPHILSRITSFINPYVDEQGSGWVSIQLKNARDNSVLFGKGENAIIYYEYSGNQSDYTIPEIKSDFIFTYIIGNFGWIIGILVVALVIIVSLIMIKDAMKIKDIYGRNLIIAVSSIFIIQSLVNILMNLGFMPITAMGLPFMSYGGTSLVTNILLIAIMLSVYRRKDIIFVESKAEQS